jgi:hypothetical protein
MAQPGNRSVEIKDDMSDSRTGDKTGLELTRFDGRPNRKHLLASKNALH